MEFDAMYLTCFCQIHSAHIPNVISTCSQHVSTNNIYPGVHKCVRERGTGGDSPVRPRGNPQPQGVLLSIFFNAY